METMMTVKTKAGVRIIPLDVPYFDISLPKAGTKSWVNINSPGANKLYLKMAYTGLSNIFNDNTKIHNLRLDGWELKRSGYCAGLGFDVFSPEVGPITFLIKFGKYGHSLSSFKGKRCIACFTYSIKSVDYRTAQENRENAQHQFMEILDYFHPFQNETTNHVKIEELVSQIISGIYPE